MEKSDHNKRGNPPNLNTLERERNIEELKGILKSEEEWFVSEGKWCYSGIHTIASDAAEILGRIRDTSTLDDLIAALDHKHECVHEKALWALGEMGSGKAIGPIVNRLKKGKSSTRRAAVQALGKIAETTVIEPLISSLNDEAGDVRESAIEALVKVGEVAKDALFQALEDEDKYVRVGAAVVLGRIGDPEGIEILTQILKDEKCKQAFAILNRDVNYENKFICHESRSIFSLDDLQERLQYMANDEFRYHVRQGKNDFACWVRDVINDYELASDLNRCIERDETRKIVIDRVNYLKKEAGLRVMAAMAFGKMGVVGLTPLIDALGDIDEDIRAEAAKGLGNVAHVAGVQPLIRALKDKDSSVRVQAMDALVRIGKSATEDLLNILKGEDTRLRVDAAELLGRIANVRAVDALVQTLSDNDDRLRMESARALGMIGDIRAVDALIKTLKDDDEDLRRIASHALEAIGDSKAIAPLLQIYGWHGTHEARSTWSGRLKKALRGASHGDRASLIALVDLLFDNPIPVGWLVILDSQIGNPQDYKSYGEADSIRQAAYHQDWIRKGMEATVQIRNACQSFPSSVLKGEILELAIQASGFESEVDHADSHHTHDPGEHHLHIRYSTGKSEAAVAKLCKTVSPLSSNILLKVVRKKDIRIKCGSCNDFEEKHISFAKERQMAKEELARRGNPRYDSKAFFS